MKLFIPEIGTKLRLTNDWTFLLHVEPRNADLLIGSEDDKKEINRQYLAANKKYRILAQMVDRETRAVAPNPNFYTINTSVPSYAEYKKVSEEVHRLEALRNPGSYWTRDKNIDKTPRPYTFPKGSVLEIDRIYIRQGNEAYSSITFKIRGKTVRRFWAKLDDANKIECEIEAKDERWPNGRFTLVRGTNWKGGSRYFTIVWTENAKAKNTRNITLGFCTSNVGSVHIKQGLFKATWYSLQGQANHYDSLEKAIAASERFNFPKDLVSLFVTKFSEKEA